MTDFNEKKFCTDKYEQDFMKSHPQIAKELKALQDKHNPRHVFALNQKSIDAIKAGNAAIEEKYPEYRAYLDSEAPDCVVPPAIAASAGLPIKSAKR